jgi:ribosome biogenesis GTPase
MVPLIATMFLLAIHRHWGFCKTFPPHNGLSTMQLKGSVCRKMLTELHASKKKGLLRKSIEEHPEDDNTSTGLVLERLGDRLIVEPLSGGQQSLLCSQRSYLSNVSIVPGDQVRYAVVSEELKHGIVSMLLPRRNLLERPAAATGDVRKRTAFKAIGSNIDQLIVVLAAQPNVPLHTVDRYLVTASVADIPQVSLLVNKADLPESAAFLQRVREYYAGLDVNILCASTTLQSGLDELYQALAGKTSIFAGQSGVGKSSLINMLIPAPSLIKVGPLSKNAQFGKHTTSNARYHHLPGGGALIDSPGVREMGVWHFTSQQLQSGFEEVSTHGLECKYKNCDHLGHDEKICAVLRASREGKIHPKRYESYRDLVFALQ